MFHDTPKYHAKTGQGGYNRQVQKQVFISWLRPLAYFFPRINALSFWVVPPVAVLLLLTPLFGGFDTGTQYIELNTWHHVGIAINSTTMYIYLDGKTYSQPAGTLNNSYSDIIIGAGNIGAALQQYHSGYMDEIRISDVVRYTSDYEPQTTPFISDSNTKLLVHSDTDRVVFTDSSGYIPGSPRSLGSDSSGQNNNWTPNGDMSLSYNQKPDNPSNNFCTLNPLSDVGDIVLSEGNAVAVNSVDSWPSGSVWPRPG